MGTSSDRPLKPLAKKKFLALTLIDCGRVLGELHQVVPDYCKRPQKSLEQEHLKFFADKLWHLGYAFYGLSLSPKTDWGRKWWHIRDDVRTHKPPIGSLVHVHGAQIGSRWFPGVGQLLAIDEEPPSWGGRPRLYEDDGGPAQKSERYLLKLLDGSLQTWVDARLSRIPDTRLIRMIDEVVANSERDRVRMGTQTPWNDQWNDGEAGQSFS